MGRGFAPPSPLPCLQQPGRAGWAASHLPGLGEGWCIVSALAGARALSGSDGVFGIYTSWAIHRYQAQLKRTPDGGVTAEKEYACLGRWAAAGGCGGASLRRPSLASPPAFLARAADCCCWRGVAHKQAQLAGHIQSRRLAHKQLACMRPTQAPPTPAACTTDLPLGSP